MTQERWPLALAFGSPRLAFHSLLAEQPKGSRGYVFSLARRLAVQPGQRFPDVVQYGVTVSPVLRHEYNVNGGIPSDYLRIGDFLFKVDPDSRAKNAVMAGLRASAGLSVAVAKGAVLSFSGYKEYRRAVGDDLSVREHGGAVTLSHTRDDWSYIDVSAGQYEKRRKLGDDSTKYAVVTVGRIIGSAEATRDVSGTFMRIRDNSTWQNRVRFNVASVNPHLGLWRLSVEAGDRLEGRLLPTLSVTGAYSNILFGSPTTLSLSAIQERGGKFFGTERRDDILVARADRRFGRRLDGYVSVERRNSSIEAFSHTNIEAGFVIRGLGLAN